MTEDYINSKYYMKKTIWIGRILFGEIIDARNYMLSILNKIY